MTKHKRTIMGLIALATLLAGCAPTRQARDVETSGFLGADYDLLREGEEGEALLVYRNPNATWQAYDRIKLDPVTIWTGEDSAFEDFSEPDRQKLADTFHALLYEALAEDYQMVEELGPGVLHVQAAITDAQTSNPALDTISSVVPQLRLTSEAFGLVTGKPGFVGEASAEAKVVDGATGELLIAAVDHRVGGKALAGSPTDSWDDVREAYKFWAGQFAYRLCTERGGAGCTPPEA
jgi:Protein of unknown function (DUF3313)